MVWTQVNFFTPLLDFGTTSYGLVYSSPEKKRELFSLFTLRFFIGLVIFTVTIISAFFHSDSQMLPIYIMLVSTAVLSNVWFGSYVILTSLLQRVYLSSLFSLLYTIVLIGISTSVLIITKNLLYVFMSISLLYLVNMLVSWILVIKIVPGFHFVFDKKIWKEIIAHSYVFVIISFFLGIYFKLRNDSILLFIIGIVVILVTYLFSPFILSTLLQDKAVDAQEVLQLVILSLPFMLFSTVLINAFYIAKKAYIVVIVYLIQILINLLLNILYIPEYSYIASAYITVFNEILNGCILLALYIKLIRNEDRR